jgi:hypothetical protein
VFFLVNSIVSPQTLMDTFVSTLPKFTAIWMPLCLGFNLAQATSITPPAAPASTAAPAADVYKALHTCEAAVSTDLRAVRASAVKRIEFSTTQRTVLPSGSDVLAVKGAGKYWGNGTAASTPFTYRCGYNTQTEKTNGVVLSEKGKPPVAATKAWQPDLSRLSPETCETAVAAELKEKHPRVGRIAFGSDSRELKPAANGNTLMEGRGGVQHAPGMSAVSFGYRCEFDGATGKLLHTKLQ